MNRILKDKVIVVSSGTKGIGREIVIESARQGATIVFGGRDEYMAREILNEVKDIGQQGLFIYTDLHNVTHCQQLFDKTMDQFGRVDGFVNYAGITPLGSLVESTEELFDEVFAVNIKAAFFNAKYAIRCMQQSGGGSIIMFGSAHSWGGQKDRAAYAVSKGALFTLTEHIAHHYSSDHIRINYLTMGWTPTEGELSLRASQGIAKEELLDTASRVIPMGRMCSIQDHVPGVMYLLSDYSSMVTGSNLRITGGEYI
jgi:NAD(P)-dependent dehydrogenase (short-subunit alcohol dehydrogenase family)